VDQIGTAVGAGSQEEEVGVVAVVVAVVAGETGTGSKLIYLRFFYSICFLALLIRETLDV